MSQTILSVDNLTKQFASEESVGGISNIRFQMSEGEIACLVGPSGAGKTTLLRCLAGLESIDEGSIHVLGTLAGEKPRKEVAMVFQDFALWPHISVIENIVLVPVTTHGVPRQEAEMYARELLKKFGLFEKALSYPNNLSGGERQRVALIRALATKPKLLLLDEITSALDPERVSEMLEMIKLLAHEGQSMIIATHHIPFATEVAHKILFLEQGKLLEEHTPQTFVSEEAHPRIQTFLHSLQLDSKEMNRVS